MIPCLRNNSNFRDYSYNWDKWKRNSIRNATLCCNTKSTLNKSPNKKGVSNNNQNDYPKLLPLIKIISNQLSHNFKTPLNPYLPKNPKTSNKSSPSKSNRSPYHYSFKHYKKKIPNIPHKLHNCRNSTKNTRKIMLSFWRSCKFWLCKIRR